VKLESGFIGSQNMVQQTTEKLTQFYDHIVQLKNVSPQFFLYFSALYSYMNSSEVLAEQPMTSLYRVPAT